MIPLHERIIIKIKEDASNIIKSCESIIFFVSDVRRVRDTFKAISCSHEMFTALTRNQDSQWILRSRDTVETVKQISARNNTKCSKCFQFYALIAIERSFSMH